MSYIDKLLQGQEVQWKTLGEVTKYEQPTKYLVKSTIYDKSYPIPVLTAGKTFILGHTNETDGIYRASVSPVIIFDDFTTANKWVDFDFKAKSSAMKMITTADESKVLQKYIYYWLNTLPSEFIEGDHKRQWISNFCNKRIPVPPLSVQEKIVEILDKFTELEAELEAELDCRKRQYAYYRTHLLDFSDEMLKSTDWGNLVQWKSLGEVGTFVRGTGLQKKDLTDRGVPAIHYGQIYTHYGVHATEVMSYVSEKTASTLRKVEFGDVIITNTSENIDDVCKAVTYLVDEQGVTGAHACIFKPSVEIIGKYVAYYTQTDVFYNQKRKFAKGAKVIDVSTTDLAKIKVPVPPISVQEKIVKILDKFDTLTNSITEGLPKEIELRRTQYEYYREQLLSF